MALGASAEGAFAFVAALLVDVPALDPTAASVVGRDADDSGGVLFAVSSSTLLVAAGPSGDELPVAVPLSGRCSFSSPADSSFDDAPAPVPVLAASMGPKMRILRCNYISNRSREARLAPIGLVGLHVPTGNAVVPRMSAADMMPTNAEPATFTRPTEKNRHEICQVWPSLLNSKNEARPTEKLSGLDERSHMDEK